MQEENPTEGWVEERGDASVKTNVKEELLHFEPLMKVVQRNSPLLVYLDESTTPEQCLTLFPIMKKSINKKFQGFDAASSASLRRSIANRTHNAANMATGSTTPLTESELEDSHNILEQALEVIKDSNDDSWISVNLNSVSMIKD